MCNVKRSNTSVIMAKIVRTDCCMFMSIQILQSSWLRTNCYKLCSCQFKHFSHHLKTDCCMFLSIQILQSLWLRTNCCMFLSIQTLQSSSKNRLLYVVLSIQILQSSWPRTDCYLFLSSIMTSRSKSSALCCDLGARVLVCSSSVLLFSCCGP